MVEESWTRLRSRSRGREAEDEAEVEVGSVAVGEAAKVGRSWSFEVEEVRIWSHVPGDTQWPAVGQGVGLVDIDDCQVCATHTLLHCQPL